MNNSHSQNPTLTRRSAIAGAAGLASAAAFASRGNLAFAQSTSEASATPVPVTSGTPLASHGINYDTGVDWVDYFTREIWSDDIMRREIGVIRDDLHCNAIALFGSDIDRLVNATTEATASGLQAWVQPRLIDASQEDSLAHLLELATALEPIRAGGADVRLNLGVELSIFMAGIFPGETYTDRLTDLIDAATSGSLDDMRTGLNAYLAEAVTQVRDVFGGELTYGSGMWEVFEIDWSPFDLIGVDAYRDATNEADYPDIIQALSQAPKPVIVTEFGCGAFEGAADMGGSGYTIVDWSQEPPQLNGDYVRDEQQQVDYHRELLDLFEQAGLAGAFVYTFIEDSPYSPDPRYDIDMASFGIVKLLPQEEGQPVDETAYWEPKAAFHALADRFGSTGMATPVP